MRTSFLILIASAAAIYALVRIIKLPSRYERTPREVTPWQRLDKGIDPTLESDS